MKSFLKLFQVFLCVCAFLLAIGLTDARADDYPPGLMFSTVLNGVKVLSDSGKFRLDGIQAVFLPDPANDAYRPYNPNDGAPLWAILSRADGTELYRLDFYAEKLKAPYWLLSSYKATKPSGDAISGSWLDLPGTGNYVLGFYLESGKFYTFPFTVALATSDDPFGDGDQYYLSGDWEDWGYFFYTGADPEQSIQFKVWLSNKGEKSETSFKPKIKVFNRNGGSLVCTSRPNRTLTIRPEWVRYEFDLIFPMEGTSGGAYFKAKDLLANDGSYVLKLYFDDQIYGEWDFTIEGGKFKYSGRTVRGTADQLTFIEGGKDAFWYKKS